MTALSEAQRRVRERVARWLSPDLAFKADRFEHLRTTAADAYWWLGEFPDATDTIRWLLDGERDRARKLDEKPISKLPSHIGDFREHLRRRKSNGGGQNEVV